MKGSCGLDQHCVNHRAPSGPAARPETIVFGSPTGNSCNCPAVVILLILSVLVNHRAPSDPARMSSGQPPYPQGYKCATPAVVKRPTFCAPTSVNQSAPSVPVVIDRMSW